MPLNTQQVIHEAREELKQRVARREENDRRIAELRILLRSLVRFMPEDAHRQQVLAEIADAKRKAPSLTDAIADLLMQKKTALTSTDIREKLEESGFDLEEYSQPLATIQATLQRLVDGKFVSRDLGKDKTVLYQWRADAPPRRGELAKEFAKRVTKI